MTDIVLTGEDSIRMAKNLFCPSAEYIAEVQRNIERLTAGVVVRKTDDGFEAVIPGPDLSFLND